MSVLASCNTMVDDFRLSSVEKVREYFPVYRDNLLEKVSITWRRFVHYRATHVWINEERVYAWIQDHPGCKVNGLFEGRRIQVKVRRCEENMVIAKVPLLSRIGSSFKFFIENLRHANVIGAVLPSSKPLSKRMVSLIPKDATAPGRRILEVGPGTGAFTDRIIKRMNARDELILVEYDEKFCQELTEKYRKFPNVTIHQGDILLFKSAKKFDFIVSGLPLNSFPVRFVQDVFQQFESLAAPGAKLSYFDYRGLPTIKRLFLNQRQRDQFDQILQLKEQFFDQHGVAKETEWVNVPPARVLHHTIGSV